MATEWDAEQSLYEAVKACAESAVEKQDADVLKVAAESFSLIRYGPQGGDYELKREAHDHTEAATTARNEYEGVSRTEHKGTSDYHETHHPDGAGRRAPGFGE